MSFVFNAIQKTLSGSSYLAPTLTGKLAFELFSTPIAGKTPRSKRIEKAQAVLDSSTRQLLCSGKHQVQSYSWKATQKRRNQQILIVHGWTSKALYMTAFVNPLLELGFDVTAVDLPAHGESLGRQLKFRDAAQAIQDVAAKIGPVYAMLGHSFGGAMVSFALLGGSPLTGQSHAERVVLIAAPNQLTGVAQRFAEQFQLAPKAQQAFERSMSKLAERDIRTVAAQQVYEQRNIPVLLIHDQDDQEVPFEDSELYESVASARLVKTIGLGHRRILYDHEVIENVTSFLLKD